METQEYVEPPLTVFKNGCPWCGSIPEHKRVEGINKGDVHFDCAGGTFWGYVYCPSCGARGPRVLCTMEEASHQWPGQHFADTWDDRF